MTKCFTPTCKCFIHNNGKDNLDKFNPKFDKSWFLGYFSSSKAFQVFNRRTLKIEEFIHVVFDEFSSNNDRIYDDNDKEEWALVPHQSLPKETLKKQQNQLNG